MRGVRSPSPDEVAGGQLWCGGALATEDHRFLRKRGLRRLQAVSTDETESYWLSDSMRVGGSCRLRQLVEMVRLRWRLPDCRRATDRVGKAADQNKTDLTVDMGYRSGSPGNGAE